MINGFRFVCCSMVMAAMLGCAASNSGPHRQARQSVPDELIGDWVFAILRDHRGSLQVTNEEAIFSLSGNQGQGVVAADYVGKNAQDYYEFRFHQGQLN